MKEKEADPSQDELFRLQIENARLRDTIDRLERRGGDEPAPLAAETQIIRAEPEAPAPRARGVERPKKARKRRKREQEAKARRGSLWFCLLLLLASIGTALVYGGLLIFTLAQTIQARTFSFWGMLFVLLVLLLPIGGICGIIADIQRKRRILLHPALPQISVQRNSELYSRRITRKLRAATTQKLSEDDC